MKTKQKFLTVTEFAKEKEVSKATIYKWIKDGKLKDLVRFDKGPWLIPDDNLSLVSRVGSGRPPGKLPPRPFSSEKEAREKYYYLMKWGGYARKITLTYDELKNLFGKGLTFEEVAETTGVTRQRVQQIYNEYFFPFMVSGEDRRKVLTKEKRKRNSVLHLDKVRRLAILKEAAEEFGFEVEPVWRERAPFYCYSNRLLINGRLCRVFHSKAPSDSQAPSCLYYMVRVSKSAADNSEFVIVITGEGPRRIFIFPSKLLLTQYSDRESYKTLYIPTDQQEPYRNALPRINWWDYEEAWNLLEEVIKSD